MYTGFVYTVTMLKNITFSADEALIREARRQAALQNTTLNELFREWLERYVTQRNVTTQKHAQAQYDDLMRRLAHVNAGRKFTREELNERR